MYRHDERVEGPAWLKIVVGAAFMLGFVAIVSIKVMAATYGNAATFDPVIALLIVVGATVVGALIGGMLAYKDHIELRIKKEQPVPYFARLFFASGLISLAVWIALAFFICSLIAPISLLIDVLSR